MLTTPLLFIGLDSIDPPLVADWTRGGLLPNLARLQANGLHAPVRNLPGFGNGVFWPCVHTGVNPARHGRFFLEQMKPGTYRFRIFDERLDFTAPSVWQLADDLGIRVALLDAVRSPSPPLAHGISVSGWLMHDRSVPGYSFPEDCLDSVIDRYGHDPWNGNADRARARGTGLGEMALQSLQRINARTQLTLELLRSGQYDAISSTYSDPHDIGHLCWHLHDQAHPLHDPAERSRLGDPLLQVYKGIDHAIGTLIDAAPGHNVIVVGGPGMTLHFFANRFLESILRRLEFGPGSVDRLVLGGLDTVLARLPWRIRIRLASATDGRFGDEFAADRRRRRYFSVPHNDNAGAIRLNLAGRDPDGLVQRGTDYYRTLDELETAMLELRNLDTGQPLVEQVIRVADVVSGPALDRLPDLLVIWNRVGTVNGVGSDRVGELRDSESHLRTGDHTADAFVLARRPDKDVAASLPTLSPMDIGASLAASLAVAPVELDGRPALGLSTSLA